MSKLSVYTEQFLESLDGTEKTRATYDAALRVFAKWYRSYPTISVEAVRSFRDAMKQSRTANTVTLYLITLRRFFGYCVEQGILDDNPAESVRAPRRPRGHLKHDISRSDLREMLERIDQSSALGQRDWAMINLMARNGLRIVEVTRSNVGDIEMLQGRLILRVRGKGRDEKDEFVVLSRVMSEIMEAYVESLGEVDREAPLFPSLGQRNAGGRLSTRTVCRRVAHYMQLAGLKTDKVTAHSLRHSFVTLAIEGGATLAEVQSAARHRSIQTTMIYFHEHGRLSEPIEDRIRI